MRQYEIEHRKDRRLAELDITYGQLVAFDNRDFVEYPVPFIIALPERMERGFMGVNAGIHLLFHSSPDTREEWTLHTLGGLVGMLSPNYHEGRKIPNVREITTYRGLYIVEHAYAGKERTQQALAQSQQDRLDYYANNQTFDQLIARLWDRARNAEKPR